MASSFQEGAIGGLKMSGASHDCSDLRSPNLINFGLSLFILVGILLSYLPQHWRIIFRRSSEGLSPYYVLLGTTSGTCAFANVLTISDSQEALACCKQINGLECTVGLMGIAQIGVQWACFNVILFLYLVYFPRATPLTSTSTKDTRPTYATAIGVFSLCMLHLAIVFSVSIFIKYLKPSSLQGWADFLGVFGTILAAIQFLPQIWTTWRLQEVGSLSIYSMCIQTPGSFVWVGSLAARLGWQGWSTWGIYLCTGILQGVLLAMSISFEIRDWRRRKHGDGVNGQAPGNESSQADERTSLLNNET